MVPDWTSLTVRGRGADRFPWGWQARFAESVAASRFIPRPASASVITTLSGVRGVRAPLSNPAAWACPLGFGRHLAVQAPYAPPVQTPSMPTIDPYNDREDHPVPVFVEAPMALRTLVRLLALMLAVGFVGCGRVDDGHVGTTRQAVGGVLVPEGGSSPPWVSVEWSNLDVHQTYRFPATFDLLISSNVTDDVTVSLTLHAFGLETRQATKELAATWSAAAAGSHCRSICKRCRSAASVLRAAFMSKS